MNSKADTKNMNQEKKYELKPKLRFPEFCDVGEWKEKKLIEICERISQGGTPDTSNQNYWNGSIEWLTPAEMGKKETRFIQATVRKITKIGLKNCSSDLLPINSVIISTRAPIGHLAINKSEMAINQGCKGLVPKESTSYDFLYYSLLNFKTSLTDLGAGNTFKELTGNSLKNFEIPFPNLSEQQKIADCLSSIDDRITAETQKLSTLKAHKKGLMQQLFPAEGETVPDRRFPEFRDDWKNGIIDNVAIIVMGNAFKSSDFVESGIQLVRMGNLYQSELQLNRMPVYLPIFFSEEYSKFLVKPLDLLMSMTGTVGKKDYGFIIQVPPSCKLLLLNQRVIKIETKENCVKDFLFQLLKNESLLNKLYSLSGGTKQANLSAQHLRDLEIKFPSLPEQKKIADCLSSLDELTNAQTQKIDTLKIHKKGLMQQLFPAVEDAIE